MSNSVEDIISRLDSKFSEQPSIKNSVMTAGGEIVRISSELWKESSVLREHSVSGVAHKVVSAPKNTLLALIKAHEDGSFPAGVRESIDLLAAASELELTDLTSESLDNLGKIRGIDPSVDLPAEIPVGTVMRFFKVLLDSPLRTYDVYEEQLSRIARYCANDRDVMTNAMNLLKQSLLKFKVINLEGIPINFGTQSVPVAIYKRMGEFQTVVILGTEVIPVNLFGRYINLDSIDVGHEFYLKYGKYLLYGRGGLVYYKNTQDDSEPVVVLRGCTLFFTRKDFVFAVKEENNGRSISLWVDNQRFENIYQCDKGIHVVDFNHSTRVLVVWLSDFRLLLFRLKRKTLFLLEERVLYPRIKDVLFSGTDMFIVRRNSDRCWIETCRVAALDNE